jgi:hypothetical protein
MKYFQLYFIHGFRNGLILPPAADARLFGAWRGFAAGRAAIGSQNKAKRPEGARHVRQCVPFVRRDFLQSAGAP